MYSVAANAIQIKIDEEEEEEIGVGSSETNGHEKHKLQMTQTGILSNRQPVRALPDVQPSAAVTNPSSGGQDLLTLARREAARKQLYNRFHRGTVLHDENKASGQEDTLPVDPREKKRQKREEKRRARAELRNKSNRKEEKRKKKTEGRAS